MSHSLPTGTMTRAAAPSDAAALADLMNRHSMALRHRPFTTAARQATLLTMPGFCLESDTLMVADPQGRAIGYALVLPAKGTHSRRETYMVVDPDHAAVGIEDALLEWIETRAACDADDAEIAQQIDSRDAELRHRLEVSGFRSIRVFHRMEIGLCSEMPDPVWPGGVVVRSLDPQSDLEDALSAFEEVFEDHWGHIRLPHKEAIARLCHRIATHPDLDPALWFLAMDRDEIAGICFAFPRDGDATTTGYVETLGIRRPWRGRGLARALLYHAFATLYAIGAQDAFLYVDSESLTGATRLYEGVGMHVAERELLYVKHLQAAGIVRSET